MQSRVALQGGAIGVRRVLAAPSAARVMGVMGGERERCHDVTRPLLGHHREAPAFGH
jgi:hypothetical protein